MAKVIVGLSGGIDSAVAAWILKQQKHQVKAVSFKFWGNQNTSQQPDCVKIAQIIGLEWEEIDATQLFEKQVIHPFAHDYLSGKTPNPCIGCNPKVKFALLQEAAQKYGYEYIATGHYVEKIFRNGKWLLKTGTDSIKDQSYMLWRLSSEQIKQALFPLGTLLKTEVKQIAQEIGLSFLTEKQESYGICFLQKQHYQDWLQESFPDRLVPGTIVDESGAIIGNHQGIALYTIGTTIKNTAKNNRLFVHHFIPSENLIVASTKERLYYTELTLCDCVLLLPELFAENTMINIRIRGKEQQHPAKIKHIAGNSMQLTLLHPVFAPAQGQSIVFYNHDCIVGGGEYGAL